MTSLPDSPIPAAAPAPPLRRSHWRRALPPLAWGMAALWSLLLLAWLTLHWGILNHIDRWRPEIEARASASLGMTVRIGHIDARSALGVPVLEARDIVLLDPAGRPALRLPHVTAAVAPRSLVALELRFEQLLVEGAELEVRRDRAGRVYVGGLDVSGAAASDPDDPVAQWFFRQHEFVVRGGTLRWTDEQRDAPPLALTGVDIVARNRLRQHQFRIDATPPPEWGERFTLAARFTQPLLAERADWRRWSGTLQATLPRADVATLRRHVDLPFELTSGEGALRAWLDVAQGTPRELTLDVALRDVDLRLADDVAPLAFETIEGRLAARREADGVRLQARHFGFLTRDGLRWPQGDVTLAWRERERAAGDTAPVQGGEFSAQRLDLGLMAQVAAGLPLDATARRWLDELAPQGIVTTLSSRWDGPIEAPAKYEVRAQLSGLTVAAGAVPPEAPAGTPGRPGLRNASLELQASERGGQARIGIGSGALELPGVFDEATLPLDRLAAQLSWRITPTKSTPAAPALEVKLAEAEFANADMRGEFAATWRSDGTPGSLGHLDLGGKLAQGQAARVARYLPTGLPVEARKYVAEAVSGGTVRNVGFRVKGALADFPFATARLGEFRIAGQVDDVTLAYVPAPPTADSVAAEASRWPALTRVGGELVFDRGSMEIRNARARYRDFELTQVRGGIRDVAQPVLAIEGGGRGTLGDALRFVNASPVGAWIDGALGDATATGSGDLKLALTIPIGDVERSTVKGSLVVAGSDVRLRPGLPLLAAARARVQFSERGFSIGGGAARVLGGDATFEGGLRDDGSLRFTAQGVVSADGMRRSTELAPLARAAASLQGQATYRLALTAQGGQTEIDLTSNLVGLASRWPEPLRKAPETALPLRVQTRIAADAPAPGQPARDTLRVELGTLLQANWLRELTPTGPVVVRGGIGVNEPAPAPASGVAANLRFDSIDVDAWRALFVAPAAGDDAASDYLPDSIALRAGELTAGAHRLTRLTAGLTKEGRTWRANVDADQLNGHVEYRPPQRAGSAAAGMVRARLARLALPKTQADEVESLLNEAPTSMPALDIVVDAFELRGRQLGRIEVEATNRAAEGAGDAARAWRLTRLALTTPEATLAATGHWTAAPAGATARRQALLDFRLDVANAGALLQRLGGGEAIRGGKGRMSGQVAWPGSPLSPDFRAMNGQVQLAFESGQFLKAEPGISRLLGVLNLQTLPRRLALDFRDVFQQGFAFDNVAGDVTIEQGVASTNNLRMRGVQAAVLIEGRADIAQETQDLRVVVVPEINAGTAALAYAVINPAVGLGAFLAQMFLRRPMMQAGTREFHVVGSWADPQVERVERSLRAPLPDLDAPAAAAAPASGATP